LGYKLGYKDISLFQKIAIEAEDKIKSFNSQNLANMAWAFSLLNNNMFDNFISEFIDVFCKTNVNFSDIFLEDLTQMYQTYLYMKNVRRISKNNWDLAFSKIINEIQQRQDTPKSSNMHKEVARIFHELDYEFSCEEPVECYFLDIVLNFDETKIAVEVEGPSHYLDDNAALLTTKSKMKELILSKLGWKIKHINYRDWDKLKSDNEKKDFIRSLLYDIEK